MSAHWAPDTDAAALIEKFQQDFASLERPRDPLLLNALMDEWVTDYFLNRQWLEINIASLHKARGDIQAALSDMFYRAHEYFIYFLPGYILMSLRDDPNEVSFQGDLTLYALTYKGSRWKPRCFEEDPRGWERVFDAYTTTQKEDIALFLRYVIEHDPDSCHDAGKAYHSYWVRFDPNTLFPVPAYLLRRYPGNYY